MPDAKEPATQGAARSLDGATLDDIVRRIVAASQPEKVILFGSAVRGEMGPHSDVDLLVVKQCDNNWDVMGDIYEELYGVAARRGRCRRRHPRRCRALQRHARLGHKAGAAGGPGGSMTPPERLPSNDPREWLNRARSNLTQARNRLPGVYLEDLCFDAQQAAEKAIKAVLISRDIEFPYVHDLARLLLILESHGERIPPDLPARGTPHPLRHRDSLSGAGSSRLRGAIPRSSRDRRDRRELGRGAFARDRLRPLETGPRRGERDIR